MSKQETLIEKLDKELARNGRFNNWDLGFQTAIEIVKEHSEYVSVDEKLPMKGVKVLAWHSRKEKFFIATYDRDLELWLNDGKPYSSEFLYSITHWIPLPSPPKL